MVDLAIPIPIIALTTNAMDGDREKFIKVGMNDYLPKPVKEPDLLSALARYLAQQQENTD